MRPRRIVSAGVGLGLCFLPGTPALANVFDDVSRQIGSAAELLFPDTWKEEKMEISVGAGMLGLPDYDGSDDYKTRPLPYFEFRLGNTLTLRVNELKLALVNSPVRAGAVVSLDFGRDAGDNPALEGMGGIGTSVEGGAFMQLAHNGWVGELQVRHDMASGHGGTVGLVGAGRVFDMGERLRIITGALMHWAGDDYMDRVFGVSPAQAAASGHPEFDPGGGIRDVGGRVIAAYEASEKVTVYTGVGYDRYLGDAADSPLVAGSGSPNQAYFGFLLTYRLLSRNATH